MKLIFLVKTLFLDSNNHWESVLMAYLRKLSSLEVMATSQLTINLCQDNSFKEVAMCLEKPISDFALWSSSNNFKTVEEWDADIDEQCQRLTEELPLSLKHGVHVWITRIALEYLSYSQRMELLFNIPRYFFMNILTLQDWTETGRINEKRLAKRFLKEERLTVWQQYRIACVYCLHKSIPHLWNRLTYEEKRLISGSDDPSCSQEKNHFVLLWSYFMDGRREEKVTQQKDHLWTYAALLAVHYGNQAALMQCWKRLNEHTRKRILMNRALQSLGRWGCIRNKDIWREKLVSNEYRNPRRRPELIEHFNLPSYYSELVRFFLSKMSKRQQLKFFEISFDNWSIRSNFDHQRINILNCFLEWPLQDHFLPTVNSLWGRIPKDIYGRCLLLLAIKYNGDYDSRSSSASFYKKENLNYDYRSMLWNLWEETPEEYKQYVFSYKEKGCWGSYRKPLIEYLWPRLLARSPLQEKDVALFKQIWHDIPQDKKTALMYDKGCENICLTLVEKGMWSFISWLLKECMPDVEVPSFKLKLAESSSIRMACFIKLREHCEKHVEGFIDWAFESDTEKLQFKCEIIKRYESVSQCSYLLSAGEYAELERIIHFCLSSEGMKLQFKIDVVKEACHDFLKDCAWEEMDKSISWIFGAEEKISNFKRDFFYSDDFVFDIHHKLVFNQSPQWENAECFYKWFCLSPEEIIELKKKAVFTPRIIDVVHKALCGTMDKFDKTVYGELDVLVTSLRWCLTDEKMVISFREEIEKYFFELKGTRNNKNAKKGKERLGYLVNDLLQSFQKEVVHDKTSKESHFMKDKEEKKVLTMKDKSSRKRKLFNQTLQNQLE